MSASATSIPTAHAVAADLAERLSDPAVADPLYDALPGVGGGRLLNLDAARGLSPHYGTVDDQLAFTAATYGPALAYVVDRFHRVVRGRVADRDDTPAGLLLSGGPASGKTAVAAAHVDRERFDLVVDVGGSDLDVLTRMVNAALRSGWDVSVLHVHRPFNYAMKDMLDRACRFGRYVPLRPGRPEPDLAGLHLRCQRTVLVLAQRFADTPAVTVAAVRNGSSPRHPDRVQRIELADLAAGGGYHYGSPDPLYADQARALDDFAADERIPGAVRGAIGIDPGADDPDVDRAADGADGRADDGADAAPGAGNPRGSGPMAG